MMSMVDWVSSARSRPVPPGAVEAGVDQDGSKIYVGRSTFQNDQLPCKVVPQRKQAYVSYNGKEHEVQHYEVMVEKKLKWVKGIGGRVPPGAVQGGRTASGEILYVGRKVHGNATCVGKVHPSHNCLYIPYGGQEVSYKDYEILVLQ